jgi:inorganic pyrophosphatase
MEAAQQALESAKAVAFPLSLCFFALYPVALFIWTVFEGRSAARSQNKTSVVDLSQDTGASKEELTKKPYRDGRQRTRARSALFGRVLALALACLAAAVSVGAFGAFVCGTGHGQGMPARAGRAGRRQRMPAAPTADISLWHDVDLHVKTWLDEDTGLFHYVNEIPLGTLDKHEVQPGEPYNRIVEDPVGSARLKAFGQPVPFNYGCFPQTYRDPDEIDELHGAPGDDDPLDVLDVSGHSVGVGDIVECRILGAVCLVDEGEADWKVFVVNTRAGPLSHARSVEDVEAVAPGRIQEMLGWMEDFKHSTGKDTATLHYKIHDAEWATALVERDHASWRRLVTEADADGMSRGHWIRPDGPVEAHWGKQFAKLLSARIPKVAASHPGPLVVNRTASAGLVSL